MFLTGSLNNMTLTWHAIKESCVLRILEAPEGASLIGS